MMKTSLTPFTRWIALFTAMLAISACDRGEEAAETETETLEFTASAYPYFHKFWNPIRERASTQELVMLIKDGEESHKFRCHSADEPLKPVILHVSKAGIHIGNDMGKELEDVSLEQLETSMKELTEKADDASVRLHVRNNVSGERVHEVLWVLARAGINHLVAPTTEPDPDASLPENAPSSP